MSEQVGETPRAASTASTTYPERGGFDVFDSLFVRQPVAGDTEAVRECVAEWARDQPPEADARTLLPVAGVTLVTLFLDRGGFGGDDDDRDALLWYVEVVDAGATPWADPAAAVRRSPLFDAVGAHLADDATVHAADSPGHRYVIHAIHPPASASGRPTRTWPTGNTSQLLPRRCPREPCHREGTGDRPEGGPRATGGRSRRRAPPRRCSRSTLASTGSSST
jgi:hypothetical protein